MWGLWASYKGLAGATKQALGMARWEEKLSGSLEESVLLTSCLPEHSYPRPHFNNMRTGFGSRFS